MLRSKLLANMPDISRLDQLSRN